MLDNRVLTISEIRECEQYTMRKRDISSLELMENAGKACAEEIYYDTLLSGRECLFVYVGTGNKPTQRT